MCDYQVNIDAASPWEPGTILRHKVMGNIYTVTDDDRMFSHGQVQKVGQPASYYWRKFKDHYEVVA